MKWPWAKRQHYHADQGFLIYVPCSKCEHLILAGHVDNKRVQVIDRSGGGTITHNEIYGLSCAPDYDLKEIGIDGAVRFYKDGKDIEKDQPK